MKTTFYLSQYKSDVGKAQRMLGSSVSEEDMAKLKRNLWNRIIDAKRHDDTAQGRFEVDMPSLDLLLEENEEGDDEDRDPQNIASDNGAGMERILDALPDEKRARVERIRAFFTYLKAHRPKQWEVAKAVIRANGNREVALRMLGISKKLYLQHIFLLVKLAKLRVNK